MSDKAKWRLSGMVFIATERVVVVVPVFGLLFLECDIVRAIIYILRVACRGSNASAVTFTIDAPD